ncbi:hypothetical protein QYM36_011892 [Artemia franciscana]|uniref:Pre-mRNA-splicing factor 18 n=1 Tax=Artemia franciscana TaxID=6661 RepID=A0AA88HTD9_ARTSF|nr:hypothetical protein QYM36_011892 [Artemia franciscana]
MEAPNKKYFRRADLVAKQEEDYLKRHGLSTTKRGEDVGNEKDVCAAKEEDVEASELPRKEVMRRLRDRNEPITLFGELEIDSFRRLRRLEIQEPELIHGQRNDFQEAMERVDLAYLNDMLVKDETSSGDEAGNSEGPKPATSADVKFQSDVVSIEEILDMAKNLGSGDGELDCKIIYQYLKLLLQKWGIGLNNRTEVEKRAVKGKLQSATYAQTQSYLRPLMKKLRQNNLPPDIQESLTEIIGHLLDRNYIAANDAYLRMAIGNAAWPIGVTMVGIHARPGREGIFSQKVAHVLNDETQRKYIQGLKRLMTRCQIFFPTDPSRCVEYGASSEL